MIHQRSARAIRVSLGVRRFVGAFDVVDFATFRLRCNDAETGRSKSKSRDKAAHQGGLAAMDQSRAHCLRQSELDCKMPVFKS